MTTQNNSSLRTRADSKSAGTDSTNQRSAVIRELQSGLRRLRPNHTVYPPSDSRAISSGIAALDSILPAHGLLPGTLSEWIAAEPGSGATSLAMQVAGRTQRNGPLIIVDRQQTFYAPAFARAGIDPRKVIVIHPASRTDELWAFEQSLRCPGIAAVLCQMDSLRTQDFRRLQLAAEHGSAIGFLIRPAAAQRQSGWADVRLLVSPQPSPPHLFCRRLAVRCLYARGKLNDQTIKLDLCDETGNVSVAAGFSTAAPAVREARA